MLFSACFISLYFVVLLVGGHCFLFATPKSKNSAETGNHYDGISNPTIIWWTPRLFPHMDADKQAHEAFVKSNQHSDRCHTTTIRVNQSEASKDAIVAFIFYGTDLEVEDLPFPRLASHRWALLHEESPMNNYVLSQEPMIQLFNYTATFRRESDYPLTTLFIPSLSYLTDRQPLPLVAKTEFRKQGLAPVLYVQSHCDVASDRDRYVLELSKYVDIDSYGKCLNNRSLPDDLLSTETFDREDFLSFVGRYKFHLSFENALCNDYVTEKLFRALHVGSVPVYRGSPTVGDWDPNFRSVIRANNFSSPEDLARFIQYLDTHDDAYETYLDFKAPGGVTNQMLLSTLAQRDWSNVDYDKVNFIEGFEQFVCDKLLDNRNALKKGLTVYPKMASVDHIGCPEPSPSIGVFDDLTTNEKHNLMEWMDNYRYSKDLAQAVNIMVKRNEVNSSRIHHIAYSNEHDEL